MLIRENIGKEACTMSQEPLTLYKLIILYMLNRANFPLTGAQVSGFILEKEYTNFLTFQQAVSELKAAGMITANSVGNRTLLGITAEGSDTLSFFQGRISDAIKLEIDEFFKENEVEMRNESSILSSYYKSTTGEYETRLIAREKSVNLIEITLSVPTEESAAVICDNWQRKNQEIYQFLVEQLF